MKLNLEAIGWPACLIEFKRVLDDLEMRDVLEVLTKDPDIVESIKMIAGNSDFNTIRQDRQGSIYRVYIQKRP